MALSETLFRLQQAYTESHVELTNLKLINCPLLVYTAYRADAYFKIKYLHLWTKHTSVIYKYACTY